jgi:hypothetical protein
MARPSRDLVEFQAVLNGLVQHGHHESLPGGMTYSFLHLDGLRYIARALVSGSRVGRLRDYLLRQRGEFALSTSSERPGPIFEELRHADRALALELCLDLVRRWPEDFVRSCRQSRVSSSYFYRSSAAPPYWLQKELRWELNDSDYAASAEEREAIRAYLMRRGLLAHEFAVAKMLGKLNSRVRPGNREIQRWNPRGPKIQR